MKSCKSIDRPKRKKVASQDIDNYKKEQNAVSIEYQDVENIFNASHEDKQELQLINHIVNQSSAVNAYNCSNQELWDNTRTIMKSINPKDKIELMLVTQIVAAHNAAMQAISRASNLLKDSNVNIVNMGNKTFNTASTLMRTYTMQMEALNKYRGKGQQKITVEHINIADGGKAVIGNIAGSTDKKLKKREGGVRI